MRVNALKESEDFEDEPSSLHRSCSPLWRRSRAGGRCWRTGSSHCSTGDRLPSQESRLYVRKVYFLTYTHKEFEVCREIFATDSRLKPDTWSTRPENPVAESEVTAAASRGRRPNWARTGRLPQPRELALASR